MASACFRHIGVAHYLSMAAAGWHASTVSPSDSASRLLSSSPIKSPRLTTRYWPAVDTIAVPSAGLVWPRSCTIVISPATANLQGCARFISAYADRASHRSAAAFDVIGNSDWCAAGRYFLRSLMGCTSPRLPHAELFRRCRKVVA